MSGITLTFSGLSVNFRLFGANQWPRTRIETPEISRTAFGTPNEQGYAFEAPHLWTISGELSDTATSGLTEAETMDAIWDLYQQDTGDITLDDYSRYFWESTTRTRALASGESANTSGSLIYYHPKFKARFQGDLQRSIQSKQTVLYEFTLIETVKVAA